MSLEPEYSAEEIQRRVAVVRLLSHLFHQRFCLAEDVPDDKKGFTPPGAFCRWLEAHFELLPAADICEAAEVSADTWSGLEALIDAHTLLGAVSGVWLQIVLHDRIGPAHKLRQVTAATVLIWEDGTILPISVTVTPCGLPEGETFTDGLVTSILQRSGGVVVEELLTHGLDGLHARAKGVDFRGQTPEDPFNVLIGTVLKVMPQLDRAYHPMLRNWLLLLRQMFETVTPTVKVVEETGPHRGGWSG